MHAWHQSYHGDMAATPQAIWAVLADINTWPLWNAGVKSIRINGDFATGAQFRMVLPDGEVVHSKLIAVVEPQYFTDESRLGDTLVQVEHRIVSIAENKSRVIYAVGVEGPESPVIGQVISADFPSVIDSLGQYIAQQG